jgi:hypothetical protein
LPGKQPQGVRASLIQRFYGNYRNKFSKKTNGG